MNPSDVVVPAVRDLRTHGPQTGSIPEIIDFWVEMYRDTVLIKIAGLTGEQLCARSVPPSTLSLLGIVRHLTEVEEYWLREVMLGDDVADRYSSREQPDGDFENTDPRTAASDVATFEAVIAESRAITQDLPNLDAHAARERHGEPVNLGWILTHLIEEYARHLGHADLLRESIDGAAGY